MIIINLKGLTKKKMINVDIDVISLLISIEKKIYIYYPSNEIKEREERKKKNKGADRT